MYNANKVIYKQTMYYKMEPGDGTCYNFSFCFVPNNGSVESQIAAVELPDLCVLVSINMAAGSGVAAIPIPIIQNIDENPCHFAYAFKYAKEHGMQHVYPYTLSAVLLALTHLVLYPNDLTPAADKMLQAGNYIMLYGY